MIKSDVINMHLPNSFQKPVRILICIFFCISFSFPIVAQVATEDMLALQYFQKGEHEKALNIYEKLFSQTRNKAQYYDSYLNTLIKVKKYGDAEKLVKRMLASSKGNYTYQVDYGRLLREQGEQEKAIQWFNSMIKDLPKEEYAIRDLSVTFYRADAYDFSIKTLIEGRKLLDRSDAFAFDLLALYRYQKNKEMLVQEYINLFSGNPQPQLLNQAKNTFSSVFESPADYDLLKNSLLRKLQKEPENISYSDLLAWQYIQQKQFDMALRQLIALDKRLKEDGGRVFDLTQIFLANKAYEPAIEGLTYLLQKGPTTPHYLDARTQILYAKNQQLIEGSFSNTELLQLEKDYIALITELKKTSNTAFATRHLASLQAFHLNKPADAAVLMEELIETPGLSPAILAQTKLELGDIYIFTGEVWEAALLYGQVEKAYANEPTGQEAKFKNAKLSYYQGDFVWAKAQLDVLKSSTSQLIANDALNLSLLLSENTQSEADSNALKMYARADFYVLIKQFEKALSTLDSIKARFPGNSLSDDILMARAKVFKEQNLLNKCVEELKRIVADHSKDLWADDALFMLAEIYEHKLADPSNAMIYYQQIINDFPGSLFVTEARKRYRNLRGDNLG